MALFKHFFHQAISNYVLLNPGTQDSFIENRYHIFRKSLHPWVLQSLAECYNQLLVSDALKFGDPQSERWIAYNDRCARFIHYQLTDMVRTIIAHNARPSYTYFGAYKEGAKLQPHTDRHQCEFTISLNIENRPNDEPWTLSLGRKPLFEKDFDYPGKNPEPMPPESEIVDADLLAGDGLLFMGRHLVHFRRGALKQGGRTLQVFMHYVQENFNRTLN